MNFIATRNPGDDINIPITINFTVGGTAVFLSDYTVTGANAFTSGSGTLIIPAAQSSAQMVITPVADVFFEPNETIILTPTAQPGVWAVGTGLPWSGTITNDDTGSVTTLTFVSNGDTNGLFHWLGTSLGTVAWSNPAGGSLLAALASSVAVGAVALLSNRVIDEFYTSTIPNQWIAWDLKAGNQLGVSKYTLRSRSAPQHFLRNWVLEGTNTVSTFDVAGLNAATWAAIDTRNNDATLTTASQYYTLTVNGSTAAYRYLRLRQTGVNSDGDNYLTLGEIEFYGNYTP